MDRILHEGKLLHLADEILQKILLNGMQPARRTFVLQNQPKTVQDLKDLALLAETSLSVSTSPKLDVIIVVSTAIFIFEGVEQ